MATDLTMNRRTLIRMAAAAPLVVNLPFAGPARAATTLDLYTHQSAPQFSTSLGAKHFTEQVAENSKGDLRVRLHLAGTLQIAPSDITQAVSGNIVQMGDDMFFTGNVPVGGLLRLPFVIQNHDDFLKASPVIMPYVTKQYADKGVTVLGTYDYPMTYVWGKLPINSLDDLKGKKVRVPSPEVAALMQKFGATPVTIAASEVPVALDRGVIDTIVTGVLGAALWKDLLSYGYLLPTGSINVYYIVNTGTYEGLDPALQEALKKAVDDTMEWNMATNLDVADKNQAELASSGKMTLVTPTADEIAAAQDASVDIWTGWARDNGQVAEEALAKVRDALGR